MLYFSMAGKEENACPSLSSSNSISVLENITHTPMQSPSKMNSSTFTGILKLLVKFKKNLTNTPTKKKRSDTETGLPD